MSFINSIGNSITSTFSSAWRSIGGLDAEEIGQDVTSELNQRFGIDAVVNADFESFITDDIGGVLEDELIELGEIVFDYLAEYIVYTPLHRSWTGSSSRNTKDMAFFSLEMDGKGGNDRLVGTAAHLEIKGGSGHDKIWGYGIDTLLKGEDGKDEIYGYGLNNDIRGGSNEDELYAFGVRNKVQGDSGDDDIFGYGLFNDLYGGSGNDLIVGVAGVNDIDGGSGNDKISAAAGLNTIKGGTGDDEIGALGGINNIQGGDGEDEITAFGGANEISGGDDNDRIVATAGVNVTDGGAGNDTLIATGGVNIQRGGADGDDLVAVGGTNIQLGGAGGDTLWSAGTLLNFQAGQDGDDTSIILGSSNVQHGGAGSDWLVNAWGLNNVLFGGSGSDYLISWGANNLQFGDQINTWLFDQVDLGSNATKLKDLAINSINDYLDDSGWGHDVLIAIGGNNVQGGGNGQDIIIGVGSDNIQYGQNHADVMIAGGVANAQHGGNHDDLMVGTGLGFGNAQFGDAGQDIMVGFTQGKYVGAQAQFGGAGGDLMLGVVQGKSFGLTKKVKALKEMVENVSKVTDGVATYVAKSVALSEMEDWVKDWDVPTGFSAQFGGAGEDMFWSITDASMQMGGADDDIIMIGGNYNYVHGGGEDDLILTDAVNIGVFDGGSGEDWLIDTGVLAHMLANLYVPDGVMQVLSDALDIVQEPVEYVIDAVDRVVDAIVDEVDALSEIAQAKTDAQAMITEVNNWFSAVVREWYLGGDDNDVLAAGDGGGKLAGGLGDDTYLFAFGTDGAHLIDESAHSVADDWAQLLEDEWGIDPIHLDALSNGSGGADILELRGLYWIDDLSLDNLKFQQIGESALQISYQTAGGVVQDWYGSITLQGMDHIETRVETLRVVGVDGYTDYRIGDAFAAGLFDTSTEGSAGATATSPDALDGSSAATLTFESIVFDEDATGTTSPDSATQSLSVTAPDITPVPIDDGPTSLAGYKSGSGNKTDLETAFSAKVSDWFETIGTHFDNIPGTEYLIDGATTAFNTATAFELPELPDLTHATKATFEVWDETLEMWDDTVDFFDGAAEYWTEELNFWS